MITTYIEYAELREKKGVTDCEVINALHLNPNFFSRWKKGRAHGGTDTPRVENLKKITEYLNR